MFIARWIESALLAGCVALSLCAPAHAQVKRPNVLFIAIDDLRPELGCYGAEHVHSPNIDRLAESAVLFERAYCQQAVCNPSRTSLMTGLRPDSIGVVGNHTHFRDKHPEVVTLPQHFKNSGYLARSIGKIYHGVFPDGASKTVWDTMGDPDSWSVPTTRFGPRYYYTEHGVQAAQAAYLEMYAPRDPGPRDWMRKLVFGPMTEAPEVSDSTLYDGKVADAAIEALRERKAQPEQPFFLAVGFIKPHSPFVAPRKYWDLYDPSSLPVTLGESLPDGAPSFAGHGSHEIRRYTDQPSKGAFSQENARRLRHGYYACISYIDAQIGRVLAELEQLEMLDDTIIVLFGDHGYHLGEQGMWGKTTNFELDTRVPLLLRLPGEQAVRRRSSALVELVDVYPTLVELAGLEVHENLEGTSLVPQIQGAAGQAGGAAFSQYPRGKSMGYSIRTEDWRYTEWIERASGETVGAELYNYSSANAGNSAQPLASAGKAAASWSSGVERINLAREPGHAQRRRTLSARLREQFGLASQPANSQGSTRSQSSNDGRATGFERLPAGPFTTLEDDAGSWVAAAEHATIHTQHQRSGEQCLRLLGGEARQVVWTLRESDSALQLDRLDFWFERWTRHTPFEFKVEALVEKEWMLLHRDTGKAAVGSFRNHVSLAFGEARPEKLRFSATTPAGSGVMIDDLRLAQATPMRIVSVTVREPVAPALIGNNGNVVLEIRIETSGSRQPLTLTNIDLTLAGQDDMDAIASVEVLDASGELFGKSVADDARLQFHAEHPLAPGSNLLRAMVRLRADADTEQRIGLHCWRVRIAGVDHDPQPRGVAPGQRIGYAVRKAGEDGVHTQRIPGLVTTRDGTLIGVYDLRYDGGRDLPGNIDVGMSRSTDGGRSWEPMRVIMDMGADPAWRSDGVGDPAILVDREQGTIWVAATWSHGNRSWVGSGPGLEPAETGQLMLVRSDDDGLTWSAPINITKQVKRPEWCFILQGPGKGISMRDGTLVFPAQYQDTPENARMPRSTIIYSRDHGKSWQVGTGAYDDTTEAQVVEVEPGVLMLNCRYNKGSVRVVMTTHDMGTTWQAHPTSRRSLIEPRSCMASLIDADQEAGRDLGGWLLFSNPDSTAGRKRIMIKASPDGGMTWPEEHRLLLDEGAGRGYSCMTMIDNETVGILYESSGADLAFQRIELSEILGGGADAEERRAPQQERKLSMPQVFGDHMVLQAGAQLPVFGEAAPNQALRVALGDELLTTQSDDTGHWEVRFDARPPCAQATTLRVDSQEEQLVFHDVLIGEVWICAGQSNMEWPLDKSAHARESLDSAARPHVRLLNLIGGARGSSGSYDTEQLARLTSESFSQGSWAASSPRSAAAFSAVAWHFGRHLQEQLDVPIGLICPAVGGTPIEAWMRPDLLAADPALAGLVHGNWLDNERLGEFCRERGNSNLLLAMQAGKHIPGDELGPNHSFKPGFMWEAGIAPLIPFAIRGAIWYQGESNAGSATRATGHAYLFGRMIEDWRRAWGQGAFPFFFVQLPAIERPFWPAFRDGQRRVSQTLEGVGMAITIDTGHANNVHPAEKRVVGERLALLALGQTYGLESAAPSSGPLFATGRPQGAEFHIRFDHAGDGLASADDAPLRHMEVAGEGGVFYPATARILGDTLVLSSPSVSAPRHARYAWSPFPRPPVNLINSAGLPASPFTTLDPGR